MTQQVEQWYRDQWADDVIIRYQNRGHVLKGTVMPPVRIQGNKFYFLRTDSVEAQDYAKGDDVQVLNPDDDTVEIQSSEWDAAVYLWDFDRTRISVNEADTRKQQCAMALGRRADRTIYDAVMAATLPAGHVFGSYTASFDPYVFKQGLEKLTDADVPVEMGVYAPLPSIAYAQLETYKIFANADWVGGDLPLTRMVKHKSWDVAHCFQLPPHLRAAYTNGTELRFRVWSKSAIGAGNNEEIRHEWERQAQKKRWFVNHTIDGAAVAVQPEGIVEFRMKADSAIEPEVQLTQAA